MVTKGAALLTVLTAIENSGISTKTCTCIHSDHAAWRGRGRVPDPADAAMMLDSGLIDESQRDVHISTGTRPNVQTANRGRYTSWEVVWIIRPPRNTASKERSGSQGELTMRSEMGASSPARSDAGLRHSRREPHDPRVRQKGSACS